VAIILLYFYTMIYSFFLYTLSFLYVFILYLCVFQQERVKKYINLKYFQIFLLFFSLILIFNIVIYFNSFFLFSYDEIRYLYVSEQVSRGNFALLFQSGYADRVLILFFNSIIFYFVPFSALTTRTITFVFILFCNVLLFFTLKSMFKIEKAFLTYGLFCTSLFLASLFIWQIDVFLLYVFIFSLLFLYNGFENDDLKQFALGFFLFNVAMLIKITGILESMIILPYFIIRLRKNNVKQKIKFVLCFVIEFILVGILLIIFFPIINPILRNAIGKFEGLNAISISLEILIYFYWILVNLTYYHGFFNVIIIGFLIFQIWAYFKNRKYFDKFGILCIIWYFTFYFYIFLEVTFFQENLFQVYNYVFRGYRYDAPLMFPVFYVITKITIELRNLWIKLKNSGMIKWKRLKKDILVPLLILSFFFCLIFSFVIDSNLYFGLFQTEKGYQGVINITSHLNNRNWQNTSILTSENYPGIYSLVFVATHGNYPVITFEDAVENQTFFNIIESNRITDVILTDWARPPSVNILGYLNNSHFVLEKTYIDITLSGEEKNSSLFHVTPWWS